MLTDGFNIIFYMGETNLIFTQKLDILVINFTLEMLIVAAWEL